MNINKLLLLLILLCSNQYSLAATDRTQLVVWANEAIIASYSYNYQSYLEHQKELAKYFTAAGWISYSKALNEAKLAESVQKNAYDVTAVATQPPTLVTLDPNHWQVSMPILVVYKNPQYQQQQHLKVVINFAAAPAGQGVRGFSMSSLQTTAISPPCTCPINSDGTSQSTSP